MSELHVWEVVTSSSDKHGTLVRRMRVPGGWLYQMEHTILAHGMAKPVDELLGYHAPVYVPDLSVNRMAKQDIEKIIVEVCSAAIASMGSSHPRFAATVAALAAERLIDAEYK